MDLLTDSEIQDALHLIPAWQMEGKQITRTFRFKDFVQAIAFVNAIAERAEAAGHHPDIDIRWNQVRLSLSTHSKGGLTPLDFSLARQIDLLH